MSNKPLKDTIVIAFGHKARQGKDFCVQAIIDKFSQTYDVRRYAFGDALKAEVKGREMELCLRFGLKPDPENKWRTLLQYYGTEFRRKQDPFYWVKQLANKLEQEKPKIALVSDLRFRSEMYFVEHFCKGSTVKVVRHGFVDLVNNTQHPSEIDLDGVDFDYVITCGDGEVEQLQKDACTIFGMVLEKHNPEAFNDLDFTLDGMAVPEEDKNQLLRRVVSDESNGLGLQEV